VSAMGYQETIRSNLNKIKTEMQTFNREMNLAVNAMKRDDGDAWSEAVVTAQMALSETKSALEEASSTFHSMGASKVEPQFPRRTEAERGA